MGLGNRLDWPVKTCKSLQIFFLYLTTVIVATQAQSCVSNVPLPTEITFAVDRCQDLWDQRNFTLRFAQDLAAQTLSVVLSVHRENRWYGIGFNGQASMVGSSAVIAWVDETDTTPTILPYHLGGQDSSRVQVDKIRLAFKTEPALVATDDTLYMTFEIDQANSRASFDNQVLALGPVGQLPQNQRLEKHEDTKVLKVNFQTGTAVTIENDTPELARTHGILNIVGWGVLLPVGAIIARYARAYYPTWFYLHAALQSFGYIFVIAAFAMGVKLADQVTGVDYDGHRALGIVLFVLATSQVSAVFIRPKKDAKIRRYWNWGHWWFGRLSLLLAAINIFGGIHIADASKRWKAGYGIILALEILTVIILETLLWITYLRPEESLPQMAMMQRMGGGYDLSPPQTPPPPYESANWAAR